MWRALFAPEVKQDNRDVWPYANVCKHWTTLGRVDPMLKETVLDAMRYRYGQHVTYHENTNFELPFKTDCLFLGLPCAEGLLESYLEQWHTSVYRFIMIMGTETYRDKSSFVLDNQDVCSLSLKYGMPYEMLLRGSLRPIQSFVRSHSDWTVHKVFPIWNGLTILSRITRGDYQG